MATSNFKFKEKYISPCDLYGYRSRGWSAYTISSAYSYYLDLCVERGLDPVNRFIYKEYFDRYAKLIIDRVVMKSLRWTMPASLGHIQIVGYNRCPGTKVIDWANYVKTGTKRVVGPRHIDDKIYRFAWIKNKTIPGVKKYNIKLCTVLKRLVVSEIRNGRDYEHRP
ncbi:hypothetical protein AGMMS50239_26070 [Bacteroidia bacterium]|nr:hypothetical protein AGMMS50239_26070 [Bacteroidia bacterium]